MTMRRKVALALVLAAGVASTAFATGPAAVPAKATSATPGPLTYSPPSIPDPPAAGPLLLRLAIATAVVLGVGAGASWGIRRFAPRPAAARSDSRLQLVETLAIGNGTSLYLLECCGRRFVAGVGATGFRSLAPLAEPFENELDVLAALT
jgi:hypothetical protein